MVLSNYNTRNIHFSLKEYTNNYQSLLTEFLSIHEDFDEKQFIDYELDLYDLCLENATLTHYFHNGKNKYAVNFGNCRFIISKIYDNLVNFKDENDGWDLELALKYQASFKKIIDYLKRKKEILLDINSTRYNNLLNIAKTPEVRELLTNIFYKNITLFSVVNFIKEKTNDETYELFMGEFNFCFEMISNEFMFKIKEEDIKEALEIYKNNLEYLYVSDEEINKINPFIRNINNIDTVYNVRGLSKIKNENSTRLVYLNNLMIDYYNGFFANEIEGFENISQLKHVYNYLNNIENNGNELENSLENQIKINEINAKHDNDYLKSSIEDYLDCVSDYIDTLNYGLLVDALYSYFSTSTFPLLEKKIIFKRVNKKKVGWALKEVYKNNKQGVLDIEYFRFAKENINLFEDELIETTNFNKSKFYKLFTTNPDK